MGRRVTCCVGIELADRKVVLVADSSVSDDDETDLLVEPKVWLQAGYGWAYAGDVCVQDVFKCADIPTFAENGPAGYVGAVKPRIVQEVIPTLRHTLQAVGMTKEDAPEFELLLAAGGELYHVDETFAVTRSPYGYNAIGSGAAYARGALATCRRLSKTRALAALLAAERHHAHVRGPYRSITV